MEPSNQIFTFKPKNFSSGNERSLPVIIAAGSYKRGEVLGRVGNVYGKLSVENSIPAAIMPFNEVLEGDKQKSVFVAGDFNEDAIIIGAQDIETVKTALRDVGIFVRKWGTTPVVA